MWIRGARVRKENGEMGEYGGEQRECVGFEYKGEEKSMRVSRRGG